MLLILYSNLLVEHFRSAKEANEDMHPEWLIEVREQFSAWIEVMKAVVESDPRQAKYVGFAYRRLATINSELGDEEAAIAAREQVKKLLPAEEWEDIDRREGSRSPAGPQDLNERPHATGGEEPSGDAKPSEE